MPPVTRSLYLGLFAEIQSSAKGAQRSRHDPELELYYAANIRGSSYLLALYMEQWIGQEQADALYATVEPLHARCRYLSSLRSAFPAVLLSAS